MHLCAIYSYGPSPDNIFYHFIYYMPLLLQRLCCQEGVEDGCSNQCVSYLGGERVLKAACVSVVCCLQYIVIGAGKIGEGEK